MRRVTLWLGTHVSLVAVLCLATFLRAGVFVAAAGTPQRFWSQDDREYLGVATHLHASYLESSGSFFDVGLRRPPVYPLFLRFVLGSFGWHFAAVVAIQIVISVATVGVVYWLAQLILPSRFAVVAAFVVAVDPASIVFANQMLTETLFTFLLTLALTLVVIGAGSGRPLPVGAAGVLLGVATLTRPVAQYLPLLLIPAMVLTSRLRTTALFACVAALLVGYALPVAGWVTRNAALTGVPLVSTIDGYNMLHYRAVGALTESGEFPWDARKHVAEQLTTRIRPGQNAAEISRAQMRLGLEILAHHPVGAAKSWARGELRLLGGSGKAETALLLTGRQEVRGTALRVLVLIAQIVTLLIVAAGAAGLVALAIGRIRSPALWLLAASVAYFVVISGGPEAYSRFRVAVVPLLAVLGAAFAAAWTDHEVRVMRPARFERATSASAGQRSIP